MANIDQNTRVYLFLLSNLSLTPPKDLSTMANQYLNSLSTGNRDQKWLALIASAKNS